MSSNGTEAPAEEVQAAVEDPTMQVRGLCIREPWASEFWVSLLGAEGASLEASQEVSLLPSFLFFSFCFVLRQSLDM